MLTNRLTLRRNPLREMIAIPVSEAVWSEATMALFRGFSGIKYVSVDNCLTTTALWGFDSHVSCKSKVSTCLYLLKIYAILTHHFAPTLQSLSQVPSRPQSGGRPHQRPLGYRQRPWSHLQLCAHSQNTEMVILLLL